MPPRKFKTYKTFKPYLDPLKHLEKIQEIRDAAKQAEDEDVYDEDEEYCEEEQELFDEDQEYEFSLSVGEPPGTLGVIDLSFPESREDYEDSPYCYPPSYYTLNPKERLLLLYAENFRRQFVETYPDRRALVLAPRNECHVQKFVCTTIRPTAFTYPALIGNVEGIASFVSDFILFEPLEDIMGFPSRLVSPATLLRKRRGNSFEMATLLCSMLIGAGFPAVVVSGVARAEAVLNDQRNEYYPYPIVEIESEDKEEVKKVKGQKYKLKPMPDLESHLEEQINELMMQRAEEEKERRDEILRKELEALELKAVDRYHFRRSHAWVAIIENAPWSIKPKKTYINEGETIEEPPHARFVEPSTGAICDDHCRRYVLIDSVWNDRNYYVNRQPYQRLDLTRWDLTNTEDWEHLLPGEPPEMRIHKAGSEVNLAEGQDYPVLEEKHVDTIRSWVMKLHIGLKEFEERFPKLQKVIHYRRAVHERYSPYSQRDGKVSQLTLYADDNYEVPSVRWSYYQNRADFLLQTKFVYDTGVTEESFGKGRNDCLRYMKQSNDPNLPKYLRFYHEPRMDSLKNLEIYPDHIVLQYINRTDLCYYQEFEFRQIGHLLKKITEKYNRSTDPNIPADKDIAIRIFYLMQKKIYLKFHYGPGALTASTREFIKPPRPNYGEELKFDPALTKGYKSNVNAPDPTPLELYQLLLLQLRREAKAVKEFDIIMEDITCTQLQRKHETENPILKFHIYDPLRNGAARAIRLREYEDEELKKLEVASKPPDFVAPYLIPFGGNELTEDEAWTIYNACLDDLKGRFVGLLNDLQLQYEDLTTEAKSLQRFLVKFEDQFNNFDYDQLVKEAKAIELNKRMVQQRLTLTHEESQKKYEFVKNSLLNDPRLNLNRQEG